MHQLAQYRMMLCAASITDRGRVRKHNEDSLLVRLNLKDPGVMERNGFVETATDGALFAVADGMGGHFAGEVASMLAIEAIEDLLEKDVFTSGMSDQEIRTQFDQLFLNARQSLMERGEEDPRTDGMGTTLVVGLLMDMHLHLAWLGDSRCNLYRAGPGFEYISRDHSYVQMLVDAGRITHEQAFDHPGSNIITRSLMCVAGDDPTPEHKTIKLEVGDRLLFCSDGLNGMLRDREIAQIMAEEQDTRGCVQRLVSAANDRGGKDNISVVLVDLKQVKMGMSLN